MKLLPTGEWLLTARGSNVLVVFCSWQRRVHITHTQSGSHSHRHTTPSAPSNSRADTNSFFLMALQERGGLRFIRELLKESCNSENKSYERNIPCAKEGKEYILCSCVSCPTWSLLAFHFHPEEQLIVYEMTMLFLP